MHRSCRGLLVLGALAGLAAPARAQAPSPWMLTLGAGRVSWDTSVAGESLTIVVRSSRDIVGRWIGLEWGAAYAQLEEQSRLDPTQTVAVDTRLSLQTPWEIVQPYVGVGPSLFMYATNGGGRDMLEPGYNVGAGLRVRATQGLVLVADLRVRGWDLKNLTDRAVNTAGEITLSVGFRR